MLLLDAHFLRLSSSCIQDTIECVTVHRTYEIQRCVISTRLPPTAYNVYANSNVLIISFYLIRKRFIPLTNKIYMHVFARIYIQFVLKIIFH